MTLSFAVCIIFSFAILLLTFLRADKSFKLAKNISAVAAVIFATAFLLRLFIGYFADTFTTDTDLFKLWGRVLNEVGFKRIYDANIYVDYPPGYLYVLRFLDQIRLWLGLSETSALYTLILKLPSMITDMLCGWAIYALAKKKLDGHTALFLSAIYLFNPVVFFNSSQWGQIDSFCAAILLASLLLLYRGNYIPSSMLFGLSIAFKPQMLVFVPVYVFFMVKKNELLKLLLGVILAFGVIIGLAIPYTKSADFMWLIDKYMGTMNYYNYYTVNAFNFWGLIGMNWAPLPEGRVASMLLTAVTPIIATILCGLLIFKRKQDDGVFVAPIVLMTVVYLFSVKMHERYLFPVFVFILIAYIYNRDKRLLQAYSALSFVHFLGVYDVFTFFIYKKGNYEPNDGITAILSLFQVAACLYLLKVIYDIYIRKPKKEKNIAIDENDVQPMDMEKPQILQKEVDSWLHKKDIICMLAVTVVYAVVAFWGLGSTSIPNTAWTPKEGDSVVLEASEEADLFRYVVGIAPDENHYTSRWGSNLKLETSNDMKTWKDNGELNAGYVFQYADYALPEPTKYVRLTAMDDEVTINEVFLGRDGKEEYLEVSLVSGDGKMLIDEQNKAPFYPTYKDETYFDEIYHARTAYENILGLEPYESTHPPLGKLIISLGIRIFGMNPFGWRFMGTLFGVLMLPVLYHLIKQLTGNSFLSTIGTFLFAFDFMHFTQTRIATIDTYAVFFILLMYDAMVVFMRRDIKTESMKRLMTPLVLSGVFMGLGIASKWTVAYGALGLAVMFFVKIGVAYSNENRKGGDTAALFGKIFHICLWCCLWFIAIPFAIYFVAFLPITTLEHNSAWSSFITSQQHMFGYHSTLKEGHFFASTWYEWPIDYKPMWYYVNTNMPNYGEISTITAMGNPMLWWSFIPAFVATLVLAIKEKTRAGFVAVVGFLSVYLPWVLISRIAFIYHYFTAVPFLIICLMICFGKLMNIGFMARSFSKMKLVETDDGPMAISVGSGLTIGHVLVVLFAAICTALFVVYLPVISGFTTTEKYANSLELFKTWYFA